ncbi:MAG: hypothetical protein ACXV2C_08065 [Candidatus Bathyarchaeia archaeon]
MNSKTESAFNLFYSQLPIQLCIKNDGGRLDIFCSYSDVHMMPKLLRLAIGARKVIKPMLIKSRLFPQ